MTEHIYAHTDIFTYLREGKPALIGSSDELGKRYKKDGTCVLIKSITFDFDEDGNQDKFFFEDDKLVYYFISLARKGWLEELLRDSINMRFSSYDSLRTSIIEKYTLIRMGLMDKP